MMCRLRSYMIVNYRRGLEQFIYFAWTSFPYITVILEVPSRRLEGVKNYELIDKNGLTRSEN